MALSAAQLEYIRDNAGDDLTPYEVSDVSVQAIYDDATQGASDLNATVVFVLRRRLGKAARLVTLSGEFGSSQHNQKYEQIARLLKYWENYTGIGGGGRITMGTISLGIDQVSDE